MDDESTVKKTAEASSENANSTNDASQAVENQGKDSAKGNDVKQQGEQEISPYQKQLDELVKINKEKDEIIEKKNRALESEKTKRKEAEAATKSSETEEEKMLRVADEAAERRFQKGVLEAKIQAFTNDPVEQEVIRKHYQGSIQKTGNLDTDFRRAVAVANENLVMEQKAQNVEREQNQEFMTGFQGNSMRGSSANKIKSAALSMAEGLLETIASSSSDGKVNGINVKEAMKNLSKYL